MVRAGRQAHFFKEFMELNIISIEWDFDDLSKKNDDEIKRMVRRKTRKQDKMVISIFSSQIINFVRNFKIGDYVITYSPNNQIYLIGEICSDYYYDKLGSASLKHLRKVEWIYEIKRNQFKKSILKTLSSPNAVFHINDYVKNEILETIDNLDGGHGGIGDIGVETTRYWLFAPGEKAKMWDEFYNKGLMAMGCGQTGDLNDYTTKLGIKLKLQDIYNDKNSHRNDVLALWQFANEIKKGDIVFAKKGMSEIIGVGIVESDYKFDSKYDYSHIRYVNWIKRDNWPFDGPIHLKTLTEITNYKDLINNIINVVGGIESPEPVIPEYSPDNFLKEVYIDKKDYLTLIDLLNNKKNIIIQGAPGVGKTFMAKRLAYSIMHKKDTNCVMMVQFHQSYSYEDFVMGYRPSKEGFELRQGSFYEFCKKAEDDSENDYFFIIDEINRGNLSKIFGELFMLIENDKRGDKNKIQLLYSDELFFIPNNVYIIGLMNTADRSLAMIDYALRRRFAFFDLKPGFDSDDSKFDYLIEVMKELNSDIKDDESLGEGFRIGHSYLCNIKSEDIDDKLNYIVEYELIPLLKEYWFDEPDKVNYWSARLRSVLDDS